MIKAPDLTDNAVGLIHTTGPKLTRLASKYGPLLPIVSELILRLDTPLDAHVKDCPMSSPRRRGCSTR